MHFRRFLRGKPLQVSEILIARAENIALAVAEAKQGSRVAGSDHLAKASREQRLVTRRGKFVAGITVKQFLEPGFHADPVISPRESVQLGEIEMPDRLHWPFTVYAAMIVGPFRTGLNPGPFSRASVTR
jgi:hypothetical protein